jgi:hypothetical protein
MTLVNLPLPFLYWISLASIVATLLHRHQLELVVAVGKLELVSDVCPTRALSSVGVWPGYAWQGRPLIQPQQPQPAFKGRTKMKLVM